jgi:DNA replication ATP-dependent helicase Dna2
MKRNTTETLILEELDQPTHPTSDRYKIFFRFLLDHLSQGNRLHLYSLFAKISYLDSMVDFSDVELRALHHARKFIESGRKETNPKTECAFQFSIRRMLQLTPDLREADVNLLHASENWSQFDDTKHKVLDTKELIRASILEVDHDAYELHVLDEESGLRYKAQFNVAEINEQFNISIRHLKVRIGLPVMAHFLENKFVDQSTFIPSAIVIDPDFLVDVTAIAESFTHHSELPLIYLMRQFLPKSASPHLLIGNIANSVLDSLMLGHTISYETLMEEVFQQFALDFTLLSDEEVQQVAVQSRQTMTHLYQDVQVLKNENKNSIAYIEPAFISPQYGIQGRLDALFLDVNLKSGKIVELKSGKPYKENEYGLNRNHYVQTLLYDMAVKSAFGSDFHSTNYILYCKLRQNRLKQAPSIKSVKYEAVKVRNDIVAICHHLMSTAVSPSLLFQFGHQVFIENGGFISRDAQYLASIANPLNDFEKAHLVHFVSLMATENYVAKVGGEIGRNSMAFSSLWRDDPDEKESNFAVFRKLKIDQKLEDGQYLFTIDSKAALSNFRRGDIVILYPHSREDNPTGGQLLKGSINDISPISVSIRLRNPLINAAVFESIDYWNAEHDFIESSTRQGYRSIFSFYTVHPQRRAIYFGLRMPRMQQSDIAYVDKMLTPQQNALLNQMIGSSDYYLLWGPPGTGKTSVMLAAFVRYVMTQSDESLLLVAYTNRAVDEICEVLDKEYGEEYVRVGSRFSVPEKMKPKLLQSKLKAFKTRKAVKNYMASCRLVVGTLASISGKEELFAVKSFDRMVVDEASQILEPHLLGLISKVEKSIFIGDHKQLPAVVISPAAHSKIEHPLLNAAGYYDTSVSLFERLFRTCVTENWHHACGRLDRQGRMHQQINDFIGHHFYQDKLKIVDHVPSLWPRLNGALTDFYATIPAWGDRSLSKRVEVVDVANVDGGNFQLVKMNEAEAIVTDEICDRVYASIKAGSTIGIICPFRAQIALIKQKIESRYGCIPEQITIDTVERYQGGARDVVIIATCAVNRKTLDAIRSLDMDGVDRKLNVALSRSREQIILIGNMDVLQTDPCYRELIHYAHELS